MSLRGRISMFGAVALIATACSGTAATPAPTIPPTTAPTTAPTTVASTAPTTAASSAPASVAPIAGGLLEKVMKAGVLTVSTDPNYAPQSVKNPDNTFSGFDIDVATEVAKRLGVKVAFVTPKW